MYKEKRHIDYFNDFHPIVNFIFFISVIFFTFLSNNPIIQIISLLGCFLYSIYLKGFKATKFNIIYMGFTFLVITLINPLVNHQGVTIITYLWDGNPLTLESILYGISSGLMLITVIIWFSCYNEIMSSDKFIYIFGKIIPASSLILSMILRFVPLYKNQIMKIEHAQRAIGKGVRYVSFKNKLINAFRVFSIFVTWALENSIETADSMKSRGYGLKGRTAFSIFKFSKRDFLCLFTILFIDMYMLYLFITKAYRIVYYPMIKISILSAKSILGIITFILLSFLPLLINLLEEIKWKYYI